MRWKVFAQIALRQRRDFGAAQAQLVQFAHQGIDQLLLAKHLCIELLEQILVEALISSSVRRFSIGSVVSMTVLDMIFRAV